MSESARIATARPPARAGNASDHVVDTVVQLLRSGSYAVGDRLPSEWELARLCGVGRSAVREAARELSALGLVEVYAGKGMYVQSLRPDLLIRSGVFEDADEERATTELLEMRLIFEPEAAALAAARASDDEISRLRQDVEMLEEAVRLGFKPPEDLGFHLDIIRAAHNRALLRVAGAVVSFYARDGKLPTLADVDAHRAIADAVAAREPKAARRLMRDHLLGEQRKLEASARQ